MSTRVYVASSPALLRACFAAGEVGAGGAHAVTAAVRAELSGEEDQEYAASSAAALSSVALIGAGEPMRRVVLALDVPEVGAGDGEEPTEVVLAAAVPWSTVAAVLADAADAAPDVARAARAGRAGDPAAERLLERCLAHELGWWATQEVPHLLDDWRRDA